MMRRLLMVMAVLCGLLLVSPGGAAADTDGALDARAAAAREGGVTEAGAKGAVGVQATWHSGTLAPGATQGWYWNNANPLEAAYKVGFSPVGASTGQACRFETVTTAYQRMPSGERKFYFVIKNVGSIACGTTVLLAATIGNFIGNTGTLSPGQTQNWFWNFFNDFESIQLPGISPLGATGTASCQIELLGSSNRNPKPGHREFHFTVRNAGSIACSANLYLASVEEDGGWRTFANIAPGETYFGVWNNANPLNAVYLTMAWAFVLPQGTVCHLEVVRTHYRQVINASGFPERRFYLDVRNVGPDTCHDVHIELATLAA